MDGFPLCAWKSDTYSKWLAQNANSIILNTMTGLGAIGAGVLTGNGIVVGGGVMEVLNQLNSLEVHSMSPDQAKGNTNSGSLNCAFYNAIFSAYQMHIKKEYAIRIDKFFDLYGYKVNTVKVPNMSNRPYWNYIKTIDINIKGDIPQRDMNKLKSLFDNGITLWHDGDNIGNYSLNNH
jgi:hypothetical protein